MGVENYSSKNNNCMAQIYEVQYQINVNSATALESIQAFQQATVKLDQMANRFTEIARRIGKVNAAFVQLSKNSACTIKINTADAERKLDRILKKLASIKSIASSALNGNIRVSSRPITNTNNVSQLLPNKSITITPKANVDQAINSLDRLLAKIAQVKANSKLTIKTSAAGASAAVGAVATSGKTRSVVAPSRASTTVIGKNALLFPTTRQVLGPVYASTGTSVAGEMIKGMGIAYGLSALMSGIGNVFKSAAEYENISQTTKNILSTHDKSINFESKFDKMNQLMRQVGVETKFTAPQVASAGKFLAMAGYNVNDIQESIRPISNLALIGDTDLGETADVVTNIMTGYEIPAQKMNNVADILTMTFTKSNTTLLELAEAFKYAGTVARQSGLEFEQTAAAIGVLGDAGIKASHAGTTLRMMLMNMQAPTKKQQAAWQALGVSPKDENGNLRDFNAIMSELNQRSKEMGRGEFTSLFYKAFRITAASGAMALVRHSDKLQQVTDLNTNNSYGVSSELAEAKKNTIEGLWYQVTSAFTESGMKGFEAMQGAIREFLQKMIKLMKSPDFVKTLSSAMQIFLKLVEAVAGVFKGIAKLWNWLPNWAKDGIVLFVKIQMITGIISGIAKSIMSTFIMIRGVLLGSWLTGLAKSVTYMANMVKYAIQFYSFSRFAGLGRAASLAQAFKHTMFGPTGMLGGAAAMRVGAGAAGAAGASAAGAGAVAGAAGAKGITLFSVFSGISKFLLTTPWGILAGAALGIGALSYKIYDAIQKTKAATEANEAWAASFRKLGTDRMALDDPNSIMIGNMRIYNNQLLTHNERVAQATELWKRYWIERNGPQEPEEKNDSKFIDIETPAAANYKRMLDLFDSSFTDIDASFRPLLKGLGGRITPNIYQDTMGKTHTTYQLDLPGSIQKGFKSDTIDETMAVQLLFAQLGLDPENKKRKALENYLFNQVSTVHNYADYETIIAGARKQFLPSTDNINPKLNDISASKAKKLSFAEIEQSGVYVLNLTKSMEDVLTTWNDFGNLIKSYDEGKTVDYMQVQGVLEKIFGPIFDSKYGLYGTEGYMKYIRDMVANPKKYGYDTVKQATDMINTNFDHLLNWYDTLDNHYKPLFAYFLNRTPLEKSLPDGHFTTEGGYYAPTKAGEKIKIDGKEYVSKLILPTVDQYEWVDSKGNRYTPQSSKNPWVPEKTNSTNDGGGSGLGNTLHNGADQSQYKSHYSQSSAPKQVIVKIENLMRVDKQTIDMTDDRQVAAVNNIKQELATALLDVVQDFNANII